MKPILTVLTGSAALVAGSNVKYVNPIVGTKEKKDHDGNYGGMIPSTGTPFAMTRFTPMTRNNIVGTCPYEYSDPKLYGFLGTHQPAQWMGESGQVAVSAGSGEVKASFADRGIFYSHDDEVSAPHYYEVGYKTNDSSWVKAELSSRSRAGAMRFTFDAKANPFIAIHATTEAISGHVSIDAAKREISGWNPERQDSVLGPFTASDFKGYFVVQFDQPFSSFGTANQAELHPDATSGEGLELSAYVKFASGVTAVNVRVGVSFISPEQARLNLDAEVPTSVSLEDISAQVENVWAEKLDRITLTNATDDENAIFYTSMYHSLQYPYEVNEVNASGSFYYSGFDNTVHAGENCYNGYSIWDTFRSEWAFLNLFAPERIDGMIQSMLQTFQEGGRLPIWQNIVETNIMIGTHSSSLIAESLAKGFHGFDFSVAWKALWKDAMVPPKDDLTTAYYDREKGTDCEARAGLTRELNLGYVAAGLTSEAGSRTLEYAYDDYTVAVAAKFLGHPEKYDYFIERSRNYRNIFNNETTFMCARNQDGSWNTNPSTWTEADEWVYTFNVQHDFPGLRDLFHGAEGLKQKLDAYYGGDHNDQTNEPSHATVFAYIYANAPDLAQSTIRNLLQYNYFNNATGLSGNDDCGQMSSWYIFNALGFYPVNPASAEYIVGSPIFDRVDVSFPQNDHVTTILASGARDNIYIKGLQVDGNNVNEPKILHTDLLKLKELNFDMSAEPQKWGANTL